MRRICRDKLFRGRGISETLEFFKWVQRGEQRFIMPHKDKAMFDIDTFIAYEPAIYKPIILDELLEARDTYPDYEPFRDMEEFLTEIEGMDVDLPVGYDDYLRQYYGDYMQLPPEEKRISHHLKAYYNMNEREADEVVWRKAHQD